MAPGSGRLLRAIGAVPPRLGFRAMDSVYGALLTLLSPYAMGRIALEEKTRARWRAYARDIPERFSRRARRSGARPCVWVHGVSVGEVKAAQGLIEAMEREFPELEVVVTVSTDTARRVAEQLYAGRRVMLYPPDLSWIVKDALDAVRPDMIVLVESEFWPNFMTAARARRIPMVLVNGHMSARSRHRFGMIQPIARRMLDALTLLCVQLETYAQRYREVGVDAERIRVTGNMKLDNIPPHVTDERRDAFRRLLGGPEGTPLIVAGSTHPTEERALARIQVGLRRRGLTSRLLIAPRHPARSDVIEAEVRREGLGVTRRSRLGDGMVPPADDVILLDTVGELEIAYSLADAVFVGGTLVRHGGQNMMEPASLGRAIVVGPWLTNFRREVELLKQADAITVVPDAAGVEETLATWLKDPDAAAAQGRRAYEAIQSVKGASKKTMDALRPLLREIAHEQS